MVLATPVLPPEKSVQAKSGRLVPGGVGGATGGWEMRGPEALAAPVAPGVTDAVWASCGPQAVRIEITSSASPARTGQWYGRDPSGVRRGGGTGRRVGLKNRCPQGRAGSTPALGTTAGRTRPLAEGGRARGGFPGALPPPASPGGRPAPW